jgi:hypothetical protein
MRDKYFTTQRKALQAGILMIFDEQPLSTGWKRAILRGQHVD